MTHNFSKTNLLFKMNVPSVTIDKLKKERLTNQTFPFPNNHISWFLKKMFLSSILYWVR